MLLGRILFYFNRTGVIFPQKVLYRIQLMLAHISQAPSIVVPIAAEGIVYQVLGVGSVWGRSEQSVIIQFLRYRFRLKVGSSYPVEFPVESCKPAHGDF